MMAITLSSSLRCCFICWLLNPPFYIFPAKHDSPLLLNRFHNNTSTIKKYVDQPVPLISVSLNTDPKNYLSRLLRSIDYPVNFIQIQIGNTDSKIVIEILSKEREAQIGNANIMQLNFTVLDHNPGSSYGFNFCLRTVSNLDIPWGIALNYDIAFYPGILRRISRAVEYHLKHDDKFGIGFTSLCCGGFYSALVVTQRLIHKVGYFDENYYPAYFEDDDYSVRVHLSSLHARQFNNTPLIHGEVDGSKAYISGLVDLLFYHPPKTKKIDIWRDSFQRGVKRAGEYFNEKWGADTAKKLNEKGMVPCKTADGINSHCKGTFLHPFNNTLYNITDWVMRQEVIDHINSAKTNKV